MKNLTVQVNANKILNAEKTELVILKDQRKKLDTEIRIKVNRKRLYPSQTVRYFGLILTKIQIEKIASLTLQ